MRHRRSGLDELLIIARNLSESPNASALEDFSSADLLAIGRAHLGSEWDIYPGAWSARQLREAIAGLVPRFRGSDRGFVPIHVGHDGRDFDGHCQRCDALNDGDRDCACATHCAACAEPLDRYRDCKCPLGGAFDTTGAP